MLQKRLSMKAIPSPVISHSNSRIGNIKPVYSSSKLPNIILPSLLSPSKSMKSVRIPATNSQTFISESLALHSFSGEVFQLKILSNWGDPNKISLSSIVFLDSARRPIDIACITSIPETEHCERLYGQTLVKDEESSWSTKIDSSFSELKFVVVLQESEQKAKFARLWNPKCDSAVKTIEIAVGPAMCARGEIPKGFGIDIPLLQNKIHSTTSFQLLTDLFPSLVPNPGLVDIYGKVPLLEALEIRIIVKSTYSDEKYIGLNAVDIYDSKLRKLEFNDFESIRFENCTISDNLFKLTRRENQTNDWLKMVIAETEWTDEPNLVFTLKQPVLISRITIWNFNAEKRNLKFGISHCTVMIGPKKVWVGRCKMGDGKLEGMEKRATDIWMNDVPNMKKFAASKE